MRIVGLLASHPRGISEDAIARVIGASIPAVRADIDQLTGTLPVWEDDHGRWGIDWDASLLQLRRWHWPV